MEESRRGDPAAGDQPRYSTLQDYLRVLRRNRLLIAVITIAFAGAGLGYSLSQEPTYEASASLSFRDVSQDLSVLGIEGTPEQPPAVRAAANAELVTRPAVSRRVKRDLKTRLSVDQLANSVTARVGAQTQLVILDATSDDADFAAKLANSYARQAKAVDTRDQSRRLDRTEKTLRGELERFRRRFDEGDRTAVFRIGSLEEQLTRVQTLKDIARPVEITERAEEPDSPVSPQPERDTILGAVVGLVLGLLVAFGRDALDRRLHGPHDIHEELRLPVVGRVSDTALGYAGLAANGPVAMTATDFEAFRVLRMNLGFLSGDRPLRSILVTSPQAGEGKSTVSMSLASAAALAGQRVLLVECDLRRPSFARRLGVPESPGLTDYLLGRAEPKDILSVVELTEPRGAPAGQIAGGNGAEDLGAAPSGSVASLICITAGSAPGQGPELLVGERFRSFLDKVTKAYDLVVVDTSPILAVADPLELVPQVESVIVCVRVQHTTREEARAVRAALSHLPERPMGAVVTGLRRGRRDSDEYYYGY